jgi:hypothetical protein
MKSPLFYICCICVFSTCLLSMEKEEVVKKVVEKMLKRNVIKIPYSCDTKTNFIALIISKLPNELTDDEEVLTLSVKKIAVQESGTGGAYFQMPIKTTRYIQKQIHEKKAIIDQTAVQAVVETVLEKKQDKLPERVSTQLDFYQKSNLNPEINDGLLLQSLDCNAEASQKLLHVHSLPIATNACERARKTKTKAKTKKNKNEFLSSDATNNVTVKKDDDFGFMFDEEP